MLKVIGVDPGLAATGVGIVKGEGSQIAGYAYTSISTPSRDSLPTRLNQIYTQLESQLQKEQPDLMVVEDIFSLAKYPKSGITLGKVTGVILLAGCRCDMPIVEIPAREAKQVLTGNGNAGKRQLELTVRNLLGLQTPIKPNHASDALGLALIGLFRKGNVVASVRPGKANL